jgi:tetrahydromethanopterin S-methyltransferase subunit E
MSDIVIALELMGYGLLGVFVVLLLFFIMTKVLMKIFPGKNEEE